MIGWNDWICQICGMEISDRLRDSDFERSINLGEIQLPEGESGVAELLEHTQWIQDVLLLCDPDDEVGQLVTAFQWDNFDFCSFDGGNHYDSDVDEAPDPSNIRSRSQASDIEVHSGRIMERTEFYTGDKVTVSMEYWTTSDKRVYACVHAACLEVAKKVFASSRVAHIRDMRGLFTAMRWREAIASKCGKPGRCLPRVNYRLGDHEYYAPMFQRQSEQVPPDDMAWPGPGWAMRDISGVEWPGPYKSARSNMFFSLGRSPLEIKDLTDCLLRNLQPCKSNLSLSGEAARLSENLSRMPQEIMDDIFAHMGRDLPRLSSRLLPQRLWKEQLQAGSQGLLPWLWDIDTVMIDAKDAEPRPGGAEYEWDWELLVRQLSRGVDYGARPGLPDDVEPDYVCTGYSTDLAHVPTGLHNRRRIWQLLEEMFVGDSIPWRMSNHFDFWGLGPSPRDADYWLNPPHVREWVKLWWDKSGNVLSSPVCIPSIDMYEADYCAAAIPQSSAFVRRLGGEVYARKGKSQPQYWQMDEDGPPSEGTDGAEIEPATVGEIYAVLRSLGYPV